jgi:hypothetical protein
LASNEEELSSSRLAQKWAFQTASKGRAAVSSWDMLG